MYKALDTVLKRTVALKVLKSAWLADVDTFTRFVQEAQTAAGLFHPHIATVLDLVQPVGYFPYRLLIFPLALVLAMALSFLVFYCISAVAFWLVDIGFPLEANGHQPC